MVRARASVWLASRRAASTSRWLVSMVLMSFVSEAWASGTSGVQAAKARLWASPTAGASGSAPPATRSSRCLRRARTSWATDRHATTARQPSSKVAAVSAPWGSALKA